MITLTLESVLTCDLCGKRICGEEKIKQHLYKETETILSKLNSSRDDLARFNLKIIQNEDTYYLELQEGK